MPLPIALPLTRNRMRCRHLHDARELRSIRFPAVIFAPCHFRGVRAEISLPDRMMGAEFSPTKAAEKAFRAIGAGLTVRIANAVVYAAHIIAGAQTVP